MTENAATEKRLFLEYWRVLQSRKEIVIAVTLSILIAGWMITLSMPKTYMAATRMMVRQVTTDVALSKQQQQETELGYNPFYLKTQIEVIKSQLVLGKVVEDLDLTGRFAKARKLPGRISEPDARRELFSSIRVKSYLDTSIIEIEVYRNAPKDSAAQDVTDIANEIAKVYMSVSTGTASEKARRALAALDEQYRLYETRTAEKELHVEELRRKFNIPMLARSRRDSGAEANTIEKLRMQALEQNIISSRAVMMDRKTKLEKIQNISGEQLLYTMSWLMSDPNLSLLRREMAEAKLKLKDLQETRGELHPDVVKQKAAIGELNDQISEAVAGAKTVLQTDYDIARLNFETLEKELAEEKSKDIAGSSERYLPFFKASDELDDLRKLRDALKMRVIEERIGLELPQTPAKIVDLAEKPGEDDYVGPNLILNLVLSLVLGLGCGVGLAFFVEYVDASVKNIDEIEQYIGAPVLGIVPQKVKSLINTGEGSAHAEAYRVLRTNMLFSKKMGRGKAICVTSGGAGEGKSFTLSNLAWICAQLGDKVLVIDSDMRRPRQHKIFNVERRPGLTDVLRGEAEVEDAIRKTSVPNLCVLPSGQSTMSATGLLDTDRLRDVMDVLRGQYDWLLFDAPPIVGVSDASVLVTKVDAVLLVIQHRTYPRDVSVRAKHIIENVGGNLLGVVFNNINITRDSYYYHSYYRYYYDAYGYGGRRDREQVAEAKKDAAFNAAKTAGAGKEQA